MFHSSERVSGNGPPARDNSNTSNNVAVLSNSSGVNPSNAFLQKFMKQGQKISPRKPSFSKRNSNTCINQPTVVTQRGPNSDGKFLINKTSVPSEISPVSKAVNRDQS